MTQAIEIYIHMMERSGLADVWLNISWLVASIISLMRYKDISGRIPSMITMMLEKTVYKGAACHTNLMARSILNACLSFVFNELISMAKDYTQKQKKKTESFPSCLFKKYL